MWSSFLMTATQGFLVLTSVPGMCKSAIAYSIVWWLLFAIPLTLSGCATVRISKSGTICFNTWRPISETLQPVPMQPHSAGASSDKENWIFSYEYPR
ncbi:hypothetical protein BJ878DRAFT_529871 [Calycina marina]|uniref:Uncharacterized protein n=1 Tax=Calycina marina TaxID=1763456 RepID=A0A9P7YUG7_9HELO|nr:hypothetical protein BJ878DRAFT_529871 [Calycina marina]